MVVPAVGGWVVVAFGAVDGWVVVVVGPAVGGWVVVPAVGGWRMVFVVVPISWASVMSSRSLMSGS